MQSIAKLLILVALGFALSGCVVAPYGPRARAYVAVPAPVVVVRPAYHRYYYGWRY